MQFFHDLFTYLNERVLNQGTVYLELNRNFQVKSEEITSYHWHLQKVERSSPYGQYHCTEMKKENIKRMRAVFSEPYEYLMPI